MTREEAIAYFKDMNECTYGDVEPIQMALKALEREPILDKIRAEIAEYGSIMVTYAITKDTKTDKGIEKLVSGVLKQSKEQVLDIIDKYKAETEEEDDQRRSERDY